MDMLVRGRHVITDPVVGDPGVLGDGAVLVSGSRIAAVGAWAALRRRHPRARVVGNGKQLLMPGLVDAHSHGRALSPIQKGVLNDYLENNLLDWAFMPVFDPELMAALASWRHLRSGCTTIHHMGFDTEGPQARGRSEKAIRTYLRSGIRLAFAPGVRNVDKLVLDAAAFLETLPPDLQAFARPLVNVDAKRMEEEYFALFAHLHGRFASEDTRVLLSPSWAQACTESFLLRAKATADRLGKVPIHMHCVQTPIQKAFSFRKYGKTAVAWLDELGLVDELVPGVDQLLPRAKQWIAENPEPSQPWDRPGFAIPGGTPARGPLAEQLPYLAANLRRQTAGAPAPAARAILAGAVEGAQVDLEAASLIETRYFIGLVTGQVAKNRIKANFFDLQQIKAGASRPPGQPAFRSARCCRPAARSSAPARYPALCRSGPHWYRRRGSRPCRRAKHRRRDRSERTGRCRAGAD